MLNIKMKIFFSVASLLVLGVTTSADELVSDFTGDGVVSLPDFSMLAGVWLEPGSEALVAHYEFEGNANDSVGTQHGAPQGDLSFVGGGVFGMAASFDGDGDYIVIPDGVGDFGTGSYSVTWWASITDPGDKYHFVKTGTSGAPGGGVRSVDAMSFGGFGSLVQIDDGIAGPFILGPIAPADTWVHYAFTLDRGMNVARYYVDGVEVSNLDVTGIGPLSSPGEVTFIGMEMNGDQTPKLGYSDMSGMMDDMRFYNEALSVDEIDLLAGNSSVDLYPDSRIDAKDFAVFAEHWGERVVIAVGTQKQLFIDNYVIGEMSNVSQELNQPVKYAGNPIFSPPAPNSGSPPFNELVLLGGSVIYDEQEGLFKMWYEATDHQRTHSAVAYATSTNGINWDLPCQGMIAFPEWDVPQCGSGSTDNNFVFDRPTELVLCVFKDYHAADPARRYKMIYREASGGLNGVFAAFSPDGINWSGETGPIIAVADSFLSVLWDENLGKYVVHSRYNQGSPVQRQVLQSESDDFISWSTYGIIMKADEHDAPNASEFYNMEWMPYENVFIGFISAYHILREWEGRVPVYEWEDKIDIQLAFSRDNRNWVRAGNREVFIPNSPTPGDYDYGMIWNILQHPIVVGDEIWIYYNGCSGRHWAYSRGEVEGGVIALAKLRLDGFVSVDASSAGVLTTKYLTMAGDKLVVNADALGGSLKVEVLNFDGTPISGFSRADCDVISSDNVRHTIRWSGSDDVSSLKGQTILLTFYLDNCKLYSFEFQPAL